MTWNSNYGAFSEVIGDGSYLSAWKLIENPDLVSTDAYTAFSSALWFYMTPKSYKPSVHDVVTGFYSPTKAD